MELQDVDKQTILNDNINNNNNSTDTDTNDDNQKIISIFKHKYLKEIILLYLYLFFYFLSYFLYDIFIPSMITGIVKDQFPNYTENEQRSKESYYKSFSDALPFAFLFVFGPLSGYFSDKYGRKIILYLGIASVFSNIVSIFISIKTNNIFIFYVFHTIGGLNNVAPAAVFASISDCSLDQHIGTLYALSGVSMGLGTVVGSLMYAFIVTKPESLLILYLSLGIGCLCLIVVPLIKETILIAKENNKQFNSQSVNPLKGIKKIFTTNSYISWIVVLYFFQQFSSQDVWSTFYYYTALNYGYGSKETGLFVMGIGISTVLYCSLLGPYSLKYISQRKLISIGLLISFCSHVLLVASKYGQSLYIIGGAFGGVAPLIANLISSIVSQSTPFHLQGSVLTGLQSIKALGSFTGALASNYIFMDSITLFYWPQLLYLITGIIIIFIFIGSIIIWNYYKNISTSTTSNLDNSIELTE